MESGHLLVISRGPDLFRSTRMIAESNSWHMERTTSSWDAIERLQSGLAPELLLLETLSDDPGSLHMLRWMGRFRPDLPVIMVCNPEDERGQKEAVQLGADTVLFWPFREEKLESAIRRHLGPCGDPADVEIETDHIEDVGADESFLSASPGMEKLRAQAELLAKTDAPILILGEPDSGKRTVARLIHKLSVHSGFHFLRVNCSAMPAESLELELFGKSNVTAGAIGARVSSGKLEAGGKGTLLLEEITEMPLSLQTRLMQVLQNKTFLRAGEDLPVAVGVRILAATSAKLDRALAEKRLREDLYYRLSAFTVHVPPLRQRKDEIKILLQYSMHKLARHYGLSERDFTTSVIEACLAHSWPGNLRELDNFVKRYLIAGEKEDVLNTLGTDFVDGIGPSQVLEMPRRARVGTWDEELPESLKSVVQSVKSETERNAIAAALEKTAWNRKAAARLLKISYRTLLYKIEQYHLSAPAPNLLATTGTTGR